MSSPERIDPGFLPDAEFRELERAAWEHCLKQKSPALLDADWMKMTVAQKIRNAFKEGARWARRREAP